MMLRARTRPAAPLHSAAPAPSYLCTPPHLHIGSSTRVARGVDTGYSTPYGSRDRKGETMAHTPIEREEQPRERTALPVRLALVDAGLSDPHACLDHLSHDLLEALDVLAILRERRVSLRAPHPPARLRCRACHRLACLHPLPRRCRHLPHLDIPLRAATQRRACRSRTHAVAVRDCMRG